MPVAYVHLSDIHFGQERGGERITHDDVKNELIDDAARQVAEQEKIRAANKSHLIGEGPRSQTSFLFFVITSELQSLPKTSAAMARTMLCCPPTKRSLVFGLG
jgi:hypothetical protein